MCRRLGDLVKTLCLIDRPDGSVLELRERDGRYGTRRLEPVTDVTISADEARRWYGIARQCGGVVCEPFPRVADDSGKEGS